MKKRKNLILIIILAIFLIPLKSNSNENSQFATQNNNCTLLIKEFIDLAAKNDSEFEKILIDQLLLKYSKDLGLPARDIVLSVKSQYDFILNQNREDPQTDISLSKLFPFSGTDFEIGYKNTPSFTSTDSSSQFSVEISQAIAENAFGKAIRLKDKIIGVEVDIAAYQITEAYEDYLATIINVYYSWWEAFQDLKIGESSYKANLKLLDNMKKRQASKIAITLDVNKINLQVLAKKEKLIGLREKYNSALNFVIKAIRYKENKVLIPKEPDLYGELNITFDQDYASFKSNSRTYKMLRLLEEKSSLEVDEEADDLLPSIDLLFGYNVKGKDFGIENEDNMVYAGLSLDWPFPDEIEKAEYETAIIVLDKTKLSNESTYYQLHTDIKNLSLEIKREKQLVDIAQEKISLAQSILKDETENYSFAKVTLNDYIDAVNVFDANRFNKILHNLRYKKLIIEWLRITDKLVAEKTD